MDMIDVVKRFVVEIVYALVPVAVSFITAWLLAKARQAFRTLKYNELREAEWIVDVVVRAAEQSGAAGLIENKKDYAMRIAEEWLEKRGISIDMDALEAMVERAVYDAFNRWRTEDDKKNAA